MMIEHIEPDLTLDGLRLLAERNPAPTLTRDRARLLEPIEPTERQRHALKDKNGRS